jgi:mannose-6-phosphate isomerase-like protein (cupin superfamily)
MSLVRHPRTESPTWLSPTTSIVELGATGMLSLHLLEIQPGAKQEPMVHEESDEIFTIVTGSLLVNVGDEWFEAVAGHTFTVPAGVPHGSSNDSDENVTMLACHSPGFTPGASHP